ncbi:GDCST [Symbiodinium sp. CCMP2592]|nr:GDCST [Symbiodinium sp. CCMP2592]
MASASPSPAFRLRVLVKNVQDSLALTVTGAVLKHSLSSSKRHDAARHLTAKKLGSARCGEVLADALCRDPDWQVRVTAAKALGAFGALASADPGMASDSPALSALLLSSLYESLDDPNAFVREAAAEAVGHFGRRVQAKHLAALEAALRNDAAFTARGAAARALGSTETSQMVCILRLFLDDGADALAAALADGVDALATALCEDPSLHVRQHWVSLPMWMDARSAARLSRLAEADACASALAEALQDASTSVRVAAIPALGSLGTVALPCAGNLVEQLLSGGEDVRSAVQKAFYEATGASAATLVAAAYARGRQKDTSSQQQAREDAAERLFAWSNSISRQVLRIMANLGKEEARPAAERQLAVLGPAAGLCLAEEVIKGKIAELPQRMTTIRGLMASLSTVQLPLDLACAALSEWIYEPSLETMPIPGLELVRVQTPEQHHGINLWAVLKNTSGCCFVVFRGSETMLDWTENRVLLVHSGFWSTAEACSERFDWKLDLGQMEVSHVVLAVR